MAGVSWLLHNFDKASVAAEVITGVYSPLQMETNNTTQYVCIMKQFYCVSCTLQHCCAHCVDTVASGILAKLAHSSHIGMVSPAHCTPLGHYICVQLMHCAVSNANLIEALQCPMCNWEKKPWNDCTKLIQYTVHLQHCCILDFSEVHFNPELCNVLMSPSITLHISE